jgi:glycosyltransferase involved in cell wall biosynthesis
MVTRIAPDLLVILNDPWNIKAYFDAMKDLSKDLLPTTMGWIAIDAENNDFSDLGLLDQVVVWTEFARNEITKDAIVPPVSVVPLGIDLGTFNCELSQEQARKHAIPLELHNDAFVFGFVGRNQPRKRIDLLLRYFRTFLERDPHADNVYLYLHIGPTGDKGYHVQRLVRYYGLQGRVIAAQPPIGTGVPEHHMAATYRSLDAYITTTQGEGWGLPVLEAMACGIPCVVPDWSGLGSWVGEAAMKIPCDSVGINAPLNSQAYTVGGIPNEIDFVNAMELVYGHEDVRDALIEKGLDLSQRYPRSLTGSMMVEEVQSLIGDP